VIELYDEFIKLIPQSIMVLLCTRMSDESMIWMLDP